MKITKAARVFGGLRVEQCSQKLTFGHEGKPSTAEVPENRKSKPAALCRICSNTVASGNFAYLVMLGEVCNIDRSFEK